MRFLSVHTNPQVFRISSVNTAYVHNYVPDEAVESKIRLGENFVMYYI